MIKLQHDLVDQCQPGDEVVVVGSLLAQWQQGVMPEVDCNVGMALSAHSIRVVQENGSSAWKSTDASAAVGELDKLLKEFDAFWEDPRHNANPIEARDFICKAVCPKLYGLHIVKLALLVTLIGGVSSDVCAKEKQSDGGRLSVQVVADAADNEPVPFRMLQKDQSIQNEAIYGERNHTQWKGDQEVVQTKRRDMSHMLLVGDPGTSDKFRTRTALPFFSHLLFVTGVEP
jgi:DNA replicative helicase MCM subunit Mcm2 (Cdc46/Mcm family)